MARYSIDTLKRARTSADAKRLGLTPLPESLQIPTNSRLASAIGAMALRPSSAAPDNPHYKKHGSDRTAGRTGAGLSILIISTWIDPFITSGAHFSELGAGDGTFSFVLSSMFPSSAALGFVSLVEICPHWCEIMADWKKALRRNSAKLYTAPVIVNDSYTSRNLWTFTDITKNKSRALLFLNNAEGCIQGNTECNLICHVLHQCPPGSRIVVFHPLTVDNRWHRDRYLITDIPRGQLPWSTDLGSTNVLRSQMVHVYTAHQESNTGWRECSRSDTAHYVSYADFMKENKIVLETDL
jgi:hypothetical protein